MFKCISYFIIIIASFGNLKAQFVERAFEVGINHEYVDGRMIGGGVAIFDANNDGLQDLFITGGTRNNGFYINNGVTFDHKITYLKSEDVAYYSYPCVGVAAADINNDGFEDLFLCTNEDYSNLILINNQDNTFDVIPDSISGITGKEWSIGATFADVNKDGWVDIFVCNYIDSDSNDSLTNGDNSGDRNFLYISQGELSYIEMGESYGFTAEGPSLSGLFTDFDLDDDLDLFVLNDFGHIYVPNEVYENNYPNETFSDIGASSGANLAIFAMGIAAGDIDHDLDLDYYFTNIGRNVLLRNNEDRTFTDITNAAGVQDSSVSNNFWDGRKVGWGTGFLDVDNNGDLDLYVSNGYIPFVDSFNMPNAMYKNNGDGTFDDVSSEYHFDLGALCRGSAYGDLDNDGDLDLVVVIVRMDPQFPGITSRTETAIYYNEYAGNNSSVIVDLQGTISNSSAIGAHVFLYDNLGNIFFQEVNSGSSHCSSNSTNLHFGLGLATRIDSLVVFWPNGIRQTVVDLPVNEFHIICEEECLNTGLWNDNKDIDNYLLSYPNPTNGIFTVKLDNELLFLKGIKYKLFSMDGRIMEKGILSSLSLSIDMKSYHAGLYFIEFYDENVYLGRTQIIKE